jgi:putative DNA primase/helicase
MSDENVIDITARLEAQAERADAPPFSEEGLALAFAREHADDLRYTHEWSRWHKWNGAYWTRDKTLAAFDMVRAHCRQASRRAEVGGSKLASAKTVAAVALLSRSDRRIATAIDQWDADPWLLGTPAGTVDLKTGLLRSNSIGDHITRITAVAPGGACPVWRATLSKICAGDAERVAYLKRLAGYCLTGSTREEKLFFLWGDGRNGKGTYIETLGGAMGDYSQTVAMTTLMQTRHQEHPTELAKICGARLAMASETGQGARWNDERLKALTGGDRLTGRYMRADYFDFLPSHKLVVSANRKPLLGRVDTAIAARMELIPFTVTFLEEEADRTLKERLRAEYPGILAWAIEGCLDWQKNGIATPADVKAATAEYLREMDDVQIFIDDCLELDPAALTSSTRLYAAWQRWSERSGTYTGSRKAFTQEMKKRFEWKEVDHQAHFIGVKVADNGPGFDVGGLPF